MNGSLDVHVLGSANRETEYIAFVERATTPGKVSATLDTDTVCCGGVFSQTGLSIFTYMFQFYPACISLYEVPGRVYSMQVYRSFGQWHMVPTLVHLLLSFSFSLGRPLRIRDPYLAIFSIARWTHQSPREPFCDVSYNSCYNVLVIITGHQQTLQRQYSSSWSGGLQNP